MNNIISKKRKLNVLLIGCPLETGNGGVTALGYSAIANLVRVCPDVEIFIQHNSGLQDSLTVIIEGRTITLQTVFFHPSSRLLETQGLRLLKFLTPLASIIPNFIRTILFGRFRLFKALDKVDAVLDVSGGDSFTSIYGSEVFDSITTVKEIAIHFNVPLYLLPQSYGPFTSQEHINTARFVFENAKLIGCRDKHGQTQISAIAPRLDSSQIIESPDIAFGMESIKSTSEIFGQQPSGGMLIGFNISGLLYFADKNFGLNFNYQEMVHKVIEWVIQSTDAVLVLVPHVVSTTKQHLVAEKTDVNAIDAVCEQYADLIGIRIFKIKEHADPRVIKGIISECDFFLGARMHACIAAISQAIPTLCQAYSDKFTGVMSMVGMEDTVVDMRNTTIDSLLIRLDSALSGQGDIQNMLDDMDKHKASIEAYFDSAIKDIVNTK